MSSNYFNCPVITVSRQYGAGGRTVAKGLSEKLGIPWYDQDFVKETARDSGYTEENITNRSETLSTADMIRNFFMTNNVVYNASHDKIFEAQKNEVLKLSDHPCIIVGRASNIILREAGIKTFDIYLHADLEHRMATIQELGENGTEDLKKFVEKRESLRKNYYKNYTKHELGDFHDYHISIDTGVVGMEKTVDILSQIILSMKEV